MKATAIAIGVLVLILGGMRMASHRPPATRHVLLRDMGHTDLWAMQRPAMARLQNGFFDKGVADETLFAHAPMDFRVSWGFPTLVKLALAAALLIVPAVVGLIWLAVRRLRS